MRNKEKACAEVGITSFAYHLPAETGQQELLALIAECNTRPDVDGILLQLPLPRGLDAQACLLAIDPAKDVDGFHPENVGRLSLGLPGFVGNARYDVAKRNAFGVLNLRAGIEYGNFRLAAFANNATDKKYIAEAIPAIEFGGSFISPGARRLVGVEAGYKF